MLVLSRKRNEQIVIDNRTVLTVVEIRGDKVRLGFVGPDSVPIDRREIHDRKNGPPPPLGGACLSIPRADQPEGR